MKKLIIFACIVLSALQTYAQSGTNSPYSQYGLGIIADQSNGFNRGMNGVGIAFHDHDNMNFLNPASYSAVDSMTFIFDAGLSLQLTNFSENGVKKNAKNADFEYVTAAFRVIRHLGLGFGIVPFSNVGYNFSSEKPLDEGYDPTNSNIKYTTTTTNNGKGGVHEVFVGLGWEPMKNLSVGFNLGYIWGEINKTVVSSYSDSYASTLRKEYDYVVKNYTLDLGAQYSYNLNPLDQLTLGATYRLGHDLNSDSDLRIISNDTTALHARNALSMPTRLGIGVGYTHGTRWRAGIDYTMEKWADAKYPVVSEGDNPLKANSYEAIKGMFMDRHKINIGGEYCENDKGRTFLSRVHYRLGASYSTPYLKINGVDGPKETSVSLGFGFPIINGYLTSGKRYPVVNISAQWAHMSMPNAITENTFRINVGLTFKERWFSKWKFE